jgi:two-component sensor histidine kinase
VKKSRSITRPVLALLLATSVGSSVALGVALNLFRQLSFDRDIAAMKEKYSLDREAAIKRLVDDGVAFAEYVARDSEDKVKRQLVAQVDQAHATATALSDRLGRELPEAKVRQAILEALRPIRFNEGRGYFFVVTLEGIELLYPVAPEFEGTSVLDLRDDSGSYVIREEIRVAREEGAGFVLGTWRKPGVPDGGAFPKLSYVKRFDRFGWYIGAGEYVDETTASARAHALGWLRGLSSDDGGIRLSVSSHSGEPVLAEGAPPSLADPIPPEIVDEVAINPIGRFFRGGDAAPGSTVYAAGMAAWDWVVAASFRHGEVRAAIATLEGDIVRERYVSAAAMSLITLLAAILGALLSVRFSRKLGEGLASFMDDFARSASALEPLPSQDRWAEFSAIADSANAIIAERKRVEDDLVEAARAQELLVREVHHRVKNNLAIISSLIRIRATQVETERDRDALADIEQRVNAISMVHARLYRGRDVSTVDMSEYLGDLAHNLSGLAPSGARVTVRAKSDAIKLPNDVAVTVGLLVSELAVNSLKHAFHGRDGGTIEVSLSATGDWLTLAVRDDGLGMPAVSPGRASLGMALIRSLSDQLEGEGEFTTGAEGTRYDLGFPRPGAKRAQNENTTPPKNSNSE